MRKIERNIATIQCECGCGNELENYDPYGRSRSYISGHNNTKYSDPKEYRRQWNHRNRDKIEAQRHKARARVLELLGGVCVKCGYSDERALQVDHVNGDGHVDPASSWRRLKQIQETPERYQLLCANCNWIKRCENHEVAK